MRAAVLLCILSACHPQTMSAQPDAHPGDGSNADATPAVGFVHVGSGAIVDGADAPLRLRCVNLGGWLEPEGYLFGTALLGLVRSPSEIRANLVTLVGQTAADAFWQQWEAAYVTEADFMRIAALGFNCVRLPVNAKRIASVAGTTVALDSVELAPVDHAVAWGAAHGVYVVLDLHATFGAQNFAPTSSDVPSTDTFPQLWVGPNGEYPSDVAAANQALTVQLWSLLATRYADATSIAGFDLLNEPELNHMGKPSQSPVPQTDLIAFYQAVISAIRTVDPHHMLFVEGDALATDFTPFTAALDPNSTYELHAYQTATAWVDPTATPSQLDPYVALSTAQHLPLWLGEFGENTAAWQQEMVALVEAHDTGWAVWPWKRRETFATHPVVETIVLPATWEPVFDYLVGSTSTAPANPAQAMTDLLAALPLASCTEDASFAATLVQ